MRHNVSWNAGRNGFRGCIVRPLAFFRLATLAAAAALAMALSACSASAPVRHSAGPASVEPTVTALRFGPVYPVHGISDPLVAKVLEGVEATSALPVSAEIRGYLVDWVISTETESTRSSAIREFVVMKDGGIYRTGMWRPAAAFGMQAPARLEPEPLTEARAREAAVAAADAHVKSIDETFASVAPVVYNYVVRVRYANGIAIDVWVDPDVGGERFFYDVEIAPVDE